MQAFTKAFADGQGGGAMRRHALQFYPAGWVGSKWVTVDLRALVPRLPACYVVYLGGALSYIGQTADLAVRLSAHGVRLGYGGSVRSKWGAAQSILIKARFGEVLGDWAMREVRLIARLQPRLNCLGSTRKRGHK